MDEVNRQGKDKRGHNERTWGIAFPPQNTAFKLLADSNSFFAPAHCKTKADLMDGLKDMQAQEEKRELS